MGKNKYVQTPEKMLELFKDYKSWVEANPILKHDFVGKDGMSVRRELQRPLTFDGFEVWLIDKNIIKSLQHYNAAEGPYKEYKQVMDYIRTVIRNDHITGGMAGIYNPNLTQRLHGIADKQEVKVEEFEVTLKL
jgi:hypothetical protein